MDSIEFIEKNSNVYVKCQSIQNDILQSKTLDLESFYEVLTKFLKKDSVLFSSGAMPKSLINIDETENTLELIYHFDKIKYNYHMNSHIPPSFVRSWECNVEYDDDNRVFKDLVMDDVILKVVLAKDPSYVNKTFLYLYNPTSDGFFTNYLDFSKYLPFPLPNYFSHGEACWGRNPEMQNKYSKKYLVENDLSRSEVYHIFEQFPYDFLGTVFNNDLSGNDFLFNFRRRATEEFKKEFESFYNGNLLNELLREYDHPRIHAPLLLHFLHHNPRFKVSLYNSDTNS